MHSHHSAVRKEHHTSVVKEIIQSFNLEPYRTMCSDGRAIHNKRFSDDKFIGNECDRLYRACDEREKWQLKSKLSQSETKMYMHRKEALLEIS